MALAKAKGVKPGEITALVMDRPRHADLIARLRAEGIETTIGTWHMPLTTYFRSRYGYRRGDFPIADDIFDRSLTLPLHERLTDEEQQRVVDRLNALVSSPGRP
jgi:dTDP-4-amino-4,6-dideoxygalactose transaminase